MSLTQSDKSTVNIRPKITQRGLVGVLDATSKRCYTEGNTHCEILKTGETGSFTSIGYDEKDGWVFEQGPTSNIKIPREIIATGLKSTANPTVAGGVNLTNGEYDSKYRWENGSIGMFIKSNASNIFRPQVFLFGTSHTGDADGEGSGISYENYIKLYTSVDSFVSTIVFEYYEGSLGALNTPVSTDLMVYDNMFYLTVTWQASSVIPTNIGDVDNLTNDGMLKIYINGIEAASVTRPVIGFRPPTNFIGEEIDNTPMYIGAAPESFN